MDIANKSLSMVREKALRYGVDTLSNEELFAVVIGETKEDPVTVARNIIRDNNGIEHLSKLTVEELTPHIGDSALNLLASIEVGNRIKKYRYLHDVAFTQPEIVFNYVSPQMAYLSQETVKVLALNIKNYLIGEKDIFIGSASNSVVGTKEVLTYALKKGACSLIIVHNHPSGLCNPSPDDIAVTKKLRDSCKLIGIDLLDHIIIGNGEFCTMKGRGVI